MDLTVSNLASELLRQITMGLPDAGGAAGRYVVRTRISSHREMAFCPDACEMLKEQLEEKYTDWSVQVEGYLGSDFEVAVSLSR
ncbi:hypothetical protein ABEU86_20015 [Pseudomonas paraversuta]|uniref:hypothetical protein n=1 Tax=Pseudomonas paraversuta TaxID=2750624 RepID=UPI003D2CE862